MKPPKLPSDCVAPLEVDDKEEAEEFRKKKVEFITELYEKLEEISIYPIQSIVAGLIFCSAIVILGIALLMFDVSIYYGVISTLFGLFFFVLNIVDIEIGWRGVPTILGKRNTPFSALFHEGKHWLPRPFVDAEVIDMRERTNDIDGLDVIATGTVAAEGSEGAKTKVEVHFDPSIQWRIFDPWKVLSRGEEVISTGLIQVVRSSFREVAADQGDDDLMANKKQARIQAEHNADDRSDRWGVLVLDIPLAKVRPTQPAVMQAYERLTIESRERPAEAVEREHVIKSVLAMVGKLNITDSEALMAFDDARGKARRRKRITIATDVSSRAPSNGSGDSQSPSMPPAGLEKAAAILGDALEDRGENDVS